MDILIEFKFVSLIEAGLDGKVLRLKSFSVVAVGFERLVFSVSE